MCFNVCHKTDYTPSLSYDFDFWYRSPNDRKPTRTRDAAITKLLATVTGIGIAEGIQHTGFFYNQQIRLL
jgi:hypothetical protein